MGKWMIGMEEEMMSDSNAGNVNGLMNDWD